MKSILFRPIIIAVVAIFGLSSCNKTTDPAPAPPVQGMDVTELGNREIKYNTGSIVLDLNKDNKLDLVFGVLLVGDPISKIDKRQFTVVSGLETKLPVNEGEETPVLVKNDTVFNDNFRGYNWFEASSITLIERLETVGGGITWRGNWKDISRSYLPVQVMKNQQRFNGWVEISTNIAKEAIILHRAAISKIPEKNILAGLF